MVRAEDRARARVRARVRGLFDAGRHNELLAPLQGGFPLPYEYDSLNRRRVPWLSRTAEVSRV